MSWRALATITTVLIVVAFTGRLVIALSIGLVDSLAKLLIYYAHERIWNRVSWGKVEHPLAALPVRRDIASEDMEHIRRRLEELGYL